MAVIKIVNAQGGSDARYDISRMTAAERQRFDQDGRPLGSNEPGQWTWTQGLPGAREMNAEGGGAGGGGSGRGGSVIPGAGTYLFEQALAQGAFDRAITALKTQRRQRQVGAGLKDDWTVDPLLQYGSYQQMLGGQGLDLDAAEANAMDRGLQGRGLGNQAERMLRYGHAVQNLGFQTQLGAWENEYQSGLGRAEHEKQMAMLNALMSGYGSAYGDWGYSEESAPAAPTSGSTAAYNAALTARAALPPQLKGSRTVPKPRPTSRAAGATSNVRAM